MSLAELQRDASTGIATITVNRPQVLNAIDVPTAKAIRAAVEPLQGDSSVRCIVLRGAGRAFVAGGDLGKFAEDFRRAADVVDDLLDALHPAIRILRAHDAPVIASVQGAVAGAGLSLMASCDLTIAAEGTRFIVAYDRIGATPDCGGTWFLPRLLGSRRAAQFMLLGETWDSATAREMGLVNYVVPAEELEQQTLGFAQRIAAGPTRAYGSYKRLAAQALGEGLPAHLEREREAFKAATRTDDFREGVSAFLGKRAAAFKGH
ncbi:enoyl-CoA hydratase/isomerase family protein [Hydrocarboniphaga sp.]|uniref:enoyl-CoA hydratase/isomerase family protein n=1 Tax=Hydrocarboniphaga sp. TaxID=2033016 RepID=UPI003D0E534E